MCNYFNNFTDNVCCPTTIWMCNEADNECFFHNSDIKSNKPPCAKCYYCLSPFGMIKDIFCLPFNCIGEYICNNNISSIETEMNEYHTSKKNNTGDYSNSIDNYYVSNNCNIIDDYNSSDEDSDSDN